MADFAGVGQPSFHDDFLWWARRWRCYDLQDFFVSAVRLVLPCVLLSTSQRYMMNDVLVIIACDK